MTGSPDRPLLFLDVDGPLIPFGGQAIPTFDVLPGGETSANPLLARINPEHGSRLAALRCELVWATSWMTDANESISPRLGLPELPVVIWPEVADDEPVDGVHWKTRTLVDWAAGRPFIWVDDQITGADRVWVAAHCQRPTLLHRVDARYGLTIVDFAILDNWLTS